MSSAQSRYIARLLPCVMHIVHMPASKARSWLHESIFNQFATTVSPLHIGDRSGVRWIATCSRADERLSVRQGPGGKTSNLDAASHADGFRSKDIPATVTSMQLQHSAGQEVSIGPAHRQHQILACWRKSVFELCSRPRKQLCCREGQEQVVTCTLYHRSVEPLVPPTRIAHAKSADNCR